ncbi:MAG: hypothetical protein KGV44_12215 [Flavobacteriaceae bacterium]|nr:hypothetical protein [Flavobacteriaceae bacterium]
MICCWLIPLLVGILCAILGYLLGRLCRKETKTWKSEYDRTLAQLEECKKRRMDLENKIAKAPVNPVIPTVASFDANAAKLALGKKIKENDLTIIEGIGPKIEELLNKNGIRTWERLAKTSISDCKDILEKGGNNYAMHNPATWPEQAAMAHEGKWKELKKWQDELDGGI